MRPVVRQATTTVFTNHQKARDLLIASIGDYCSYCESPCPGAVEHILPWENKHAALELEWTNFLLTCIGCNNYKKSRQDCQPLHDTKQARAKYLWPDVDNTARAFVYRSDNRVIVAPGLSAPVDGVAANTRILLGLEENKGLRWKRREQAWTEATTSARNLVACDTPEMRDQIARTAAGRGFWSVWRSVFAGDTDMLQRLNQVFTGTAADCFDPVTVQVVPRPGGQL